MHVVCGRARACVWDSIAYVCARLCLLGCCGGPDAETVVHGDDLY